MDDSVRIPNQLVSYEGVCLTAPATPGLLNTLTSEILACRGELPTLPVPSYTAVTHLVSPNTSLQRKTQFNFLPRIYLFIRLMIFQTKY